MDEPKMKIEYFLRMRDPVEGYRYEGKHHIVFEKNLDNGKEFVGYGTVEELKQHAIGFYDGTEGVIVRRATMTIVSEFEDVD